MDYNKYSRNYKKPFSDSLNTSWNTVEHSVGYLKSHYKRNKGIVRLVLDRIKYGSLKRNIL